MKSISLTLSKRMHTHETSSVAKLHFLAVLNLTTKSMTDTQRFIISIVKRFICLSAIEIFS